MSLPPSPTLLQEARDEAFAVCLALGTSLPLSATKADTRHVSLVSWQHHHRPGCRWLRADMPPATAPPTTAPITLYKFGTFEVFFVTWDFRPEFSSPGRPRLRAHDIDDATLVGASNGPPPCTSSRHAA
ncbi:hypothetical protein DFH08DRAFT_974736 [Mycena albidolilacea]|uniref:Uncharacterized protein n=1 Tax=Mycena albidolilacea TaxID=1033008 RepID=A0AAD6Z6V6_9AGAR|nr:hypothetical protein DFH08DRAFT_974736 [Mycena albidolilacea]